MIIRKYTNLFLSILISIILFSCSDKDNTPTEPVPNDNAGTPTTTYTNHIKIIYTNDEHGWMLPAGNYGGAAGMMGLWNENGYISDDSYLILSGGDMWTGPAISTWFEGESMVDVMNEMEYDAAAIGNHEFDFKIEGLKKRMAESDFPFLSCNIREKSSGNQPDFIAPYIIKLVDGVKVGIIGLSSISTSYTTFPANVADYEFINYSEALNQIVPEIKANGAKLLIVIGHIGVQEMTRLATTAKSLGISVITGGHTHEEYNNVVDGVALIESGAEFHNFVSLDVYYDSTSHSVFEFEGEIHENIGGTPGPLVQSIVEVWQIKADAVLSEVIGYTDVEIDRYSNEMHNMVTDSWFYTFPYVDVTTTNAGGIRQSIPIGDITVGTIVGLLPFQNVIVELEMTGTQMRNSTNFLLISGMTRDNGNYIVGNVPLNESKTYKVLTTDYLYSIEDSGFMSADGTPYNTSVHYRQPLIDWLNSIKTSRTNPLSKYLDGKKR